MNEPIIEVETTGPEREHCFRVVIKARLSPEDTVRTPVEIMFHARQLVDLIHKCSSALCDWQKASTEYLLDRLTVYKATLDFDPARFIFQPGSCIQVENPPLLGAQDLQFLAEVHHTAAVVAQIDWRNSVPEQEHDARIDAMNRLRDALTKQP